MVVLFTNIGLSRRTGTEVVTAALARAMKARGHTSMVYARSLGEVAREIAAEGIPVVSNLARLPATPDVIHGHHHLETVEALRRFPETPALFVCHDVHAWHDQVPRHPNLRRFVAVGLNARRRLLQDWPRTRGRIDVIGNGVDLTRFLPRAPLPRAPRRALVFSNDAGENSHWEPVAEACAQAGIQVERIGLAAGRQVASPETILGDYDLVFAKGRCALEAAAVGTAVILCDVQGLGEMLGAHNIGHLYEWNFGMKTLSRTATPARILEEIRRYDADSSEKVRDFVRTNANLSQAVDRYLDVYHRVRAEGVRRGFRRRSRVLYPATEKLTLNDQRRLGIEIEECPAEVPSATWFELSVSVRNRTRVPVTTSPPWPSLLFYRWVEDGFVEDLAVETPRGLVQPPVYPGRTGEFTIRAFAPRKPGSFRLRVTLIQEGWRWLDELEPRVFAEHRIRVVPPGA